jgi:hypothetical protein
MRDPDTHGGFTGSFSAQVAGSAIALEHALLMLLLLAGLLSIRGEQRRWVPWAVLASIVLSLFTPLYTIEMVWPLLSALVLPPLLWQMAVRLAIAQPVFTWRAIVSWGLTAVLIGLVLSGSGTLSLAGALLLGILAASLVWQLHERSIRTSELGMFAQLALAVLLTEIDITLRPLRPFLGSLVAGGGLGLILGYIGVRIALRLPVGAARNRFCLALSYAAYLLGIVPPWGLPGASGVVLTLVTALVMAIYGSHAGLWPTLTALPVVLNHRGMILLMVGVLLVLGWQAHVPMTSDRAVATGLGLGAAGLGLLLRSWLAPLPGEETRPLLSTLLRTEGKVLLLLFGTLWLWPPEAVLAPGALALALLTALITVGLLRAIHSTIFDLLGSEPQSKPPVDQ